MPAAIIDGKAVAKELRGKLEKSIERLRTSHGITPGLAVVLVGDNPASRVYVNSKKKACEALGIYSEEHVLPGGTRPEVLAELVARLNRDPRIHGILLQLPLPAGLDAAPFVEMIDPEKDVDGFHPVNMGKLLAGGDGFVPCTPAGILELISRTDLPLKGKKAVVVGRSNIVGKPVSILLLSAHCTVTMCHSRTEDLPGECRTADILVVAIGRPEFVKGDWVKPGAVVVDVGMNRLEDGRLVGDVEFEPASRVAGGITPVPGGVGPMTIAMLMKNTYEAALKRLPEGNRLPG
ncbi:MAG: bifunctional methylenetetrahydrofolate dehydrogenase/methenyltetrahydrofolate cyclohydrolase FolD [Firmicutes bacterium]|nr:bifunctional methylenetetrahydrofolate dehydrogenase/methenyltetrahydrofolate cyclohydrolase FolD [Bacillota bacterium]